MEIADIRRERLAVYLILVSLALLIINSLRAREGEERRRAQRASRIQQLKETSREVINGAAPDKR